MEVGPLALVYEYAPHLNNDKYGSIQSLQLMFDCKIINGTTPQLPANPDPNQTGVKWIKLNDLHSIELYPNIQEQIIQYSKTKETITYIEEQKLERYVNIDN